MASSVLCPIYQPHCPHSLTLEEIETLAALQAEYDNDGSPEKISLMAGVYRTDQGHPFVLPAIQMVNFVVYCRIQRSTSLTNIQTQARRRLFENPNWSHEYPPSHLGTKRFRSLSEAHFFGEDSPLLKEGR